MTSFASGRNAYGFCERCGLRYDYAEFKAETVKGVPKNNRVCPECWDGDHPQNFVGTFKIEDPQALKRPVAEINTDAINAFPTLYVRPYGMYTSVIIGSVRVTT